MVGALSQLKPTIKSTQTKELDSNSLLKQKFSLWDFDVSEDSGWYWGMVLKSPQKFISIRTMIQI